MADTRLDPTRYAERVLVVLESCQGVIARCARLSTIVRQPETRYNALKNPDYKSVRTKLMKTFPELSDLKDANNAKSFKQNASKFVLELQAAYTLLTDVSVHASLHLATLKGMLEGLSSLDLCCLRPSTMDVVALFSSYVRLVFFVSTHLEDRKMIAAVYAAACQAASGKSCENFPKLAWHLQKFDEPAKNLFEQFKDVSGHLGTLVGALFPTIQLMTVGSGQLLRRGAFTLTDGSSADLSKPTLTPFSPREKENGRLLHVELLDGRRAVDFVVLATIACPTILQTPGEVMICAQMACNDSLVLRLQGGFTLNVQTELETLAKQWPPKTLLKTWPRDLKLPKLFKDWAKESTAQCGLHHRERRAYLLSEVEVATQLVIACPGIAAPKLPLLLALLSLGVDEACWQLRHVQAMPRKDRLKVYEPRDYEEPRIAVFVGALAHLELVIRRQRADIARYYVEYIAGPDASKVKRLLSGVDVPGTSLAEQCAGLAGQEAVVVEAARRLDLDGQYLAGKYSAAATKANPAALLRLNWRRVSAVLATRDNDESTGAAAKNFLLMTGMNSVMEHCSFADGSFLQEHASLGSMWPHRSRLMESAQLATHGDSSKTEYTAAAGMMRALLTLARSSKSVSWHPASFNDLREIEDSAKRTATAACRDVLGAAIKASLHKLYKSETNLAEQVAPVQAAYRAERREVAISQADRHRSARPKEEEAAGYESLAENSKLVEPMVHAEARLACLLEAAEDYSEDGVVAGDFMYRPMDYARGAVLAFVEEMVPLCFFDEHSQLKRPTTSEQEFKSVLIAVGRAGTYMGAGNLDYYGLVRKLFTGEGGKRSVIAESVASLYVQLASQEFLKNAVYIPNRKAWVIAKNPESFTDKYVWSQLYDEEISKAEMFLSRNEVSAMVRVIGHDCAAALDAHLVKAAVDVMAKLRPLICSAKMAPLYERVKKGFLNGDWVAAFQELKSTPILDKIAEGASRLGDLLRLRQLVRECSCEELRRVAPHLAEAAKLATSLLPSHKRCEISPPYFLMPTAPLHDNPRSLDDESKEREPDGYETDKNLFEEAKALMENPKEWALLPYALALSMLSEQVWKPARWVPDLSAFNNGLHATPTALKALAHCFNGLPPTDPRSSARSTAVVAEFVKASSAMVTYMRINEQSFEAYPLRAMCAYIEITSKESGIPRSFLEQHLPFAVIHHALMDISMGRQTFIDERNAGPPNISVFDVEPTAKLPKPPPVAA